MQQHIQRSLGHHHLATWLQEHGLTHEQAAAKFGFSRSYLTEIMSLRRRASRRVIEAVALGTRGAVSPADWFVAPPQAAAEDGQAA